MNTLVPRFSDFDTRWNHLVDKLWDNELSALPLDVKNMGYPKVDISYTDNEIKIEAAVPGLNEDQLDVSYENGYLTISGHKQERVENEKKTRSELYRRSFSRKFSISPEMVDLNSITSALKDGMLTINIPKLTDHKEDSVLKIPINKD